MSKDKRTVTVVLGMHRSGTSVIARSLEVLGVSLGDNLFSGKPDNPKGFWEDVSCIEFNEILLTHFQSHYHKFNFNWAKCTLDSFAKDVKFKAVNYVKSQCDQYISWGFKDPRACRLLPFWQDVLEEVGCDVNYIIVIRNPKSVATSLFKRNGFPFEKNYFLWLQDMLHVMNGIRHRSCVVVDYDLMMADPQNQLNRIARSLSIDISKSTESALDDYCSEFLDSQLRHTTFTIEQLEKDESVPQDVITLYRILSRVARDETSIDSIEVIKTIESLAERMKAFTPAFDYVSVLQAEKDALQGSKDALQGSKDALQGSKDALQESKDALQESKDALQESKDALQESKDALQEDNIYYKKLLADLTEKISKNEEELKAVCAQLESTYLTVSWRVTWPLRFIRHQCVSSIYHIVRHCASGWARYLWRAIPIAEKNKQQFKVSLFKKIPQFFSWSLAYRAWKEEVALSMLDKDAAPRVSSIEQKCAGFPFISKGRSVVYVTHDCHPQGAQILSLAIVKQLAMENIEVHIVALHGGELEKEFAEIGSLFVLEKSGNVKLLHLLRYLYSQGCESAITSTVVSGRLLPALKSHGFQVISLVHELPGVIASMRQEENAENIATGSDKIVFPALFVKDEFETVVPINPEKIVIRTQGVSRVNPYKGANLFARDEICRRHGLSCGTKIILAAGVIYPRKGTDLFVDIAGKVLEKRQDVALIWLGSDYDSYKELIDKKVKDLGVYDHIIFPGFVSDPSLYFAAASVYALTSREDPFPSVILESDEVGVPVVAFEKTTGAQEFILEQGGCIAKAFDIDAFSDAVLFLLEEDRALKATNHKSLSIKEYALDIMWHLNGLKRVSVIVPNYNYAHLIEKRLDSICNQSYPIYELIILDDASTDDSVKIIKDYLAEKNIEASVIVNTLNSASVFRQWEKGAALAKGDLVWIAEADDLSELDFLEKLVSGFQDKDLSMAFCQSKKINQDGGVIAENYFDYTDDVSNRWHKDYMVNGVSEISEALCVKNTIPNVSAVVFEKNALIRSINKLGKLLFEYSVAGDYLVYLNVLTTGKIAFFSDALNLHCCHEESVTRSLGMKRHIEEILKVQKIAAKLGEPREDVLKKADQYVARLCKHFEVPRESLFDNLPSRLRREELVDD